MFKCFRKPEKRGDKWGYRGSGRFSVFLEKFGLEHGLREGKDWTECGHSGDPGGGGGRVVLSSPEVVLGDVDCAGCLKPGCGGRSVRGACAGGRGRWLRLKLQGSVEEPEKAQLVRWGHRGEPVVVEARAHSGLKEGAGAPVERC